MVEAKINQLLGHGIPAVFYIGFGCFFLLLTLKRCRDVEARASKSNHRPLSYSDIYRTENPTVLLRAGYVILVCSLFGLIVEATGGMRGTGHGIFHQMAHESMYISYLFVGTIFLLERRLFPFVHRMALSFTFLLCYCMWREHALMKDEMADRRIHMIQAEVNFALFLAWAYSYYNPMSLISYVFSLGLLVLNGTWLLTAGLAAYCVDLTMHLVAPVFVLEALFIATAIVLCTVCFLEPTSNIEKNGSGNKYSTLTTAGEVCELQEYSADDDEESGLSIIEAVVQ